MTSFFHDPQVDDSERRRLLYEGSIFVYSPRPATLRLVEHTRDMCRQAFAELDPEQAQHAMPVEAYADLLGKLKPAFIHHPKSSECLREVLGELGCDRDETFLDVPRLRSSTSDGYLTTGIAFAWHPHRDTWYSAPACQLNWWIPIWPITELNTMCFYPAYHSRAIQNDSHRYNYYNHNATNRGSHVAKMTQQDPRPMPAPTEPVDTSSELRVVAPVGAVVLFSGAQLHASVPNKSGVTRFSVDFRTVNAHDLAARRGAPMLDVACGGTTIRDYRSLSTGQQLPEEIVELYHDQDVDGGRLVFDNRAR